MDTDPGGPKTRESGSGFGSGTLEQTHRIYTFISTPELSHNKDTFLDIFHAFPSCFLNLVKSRKISVLFLDSKIVFLLNRDPGTELVNYNQNGKNDTFKQNSVKDPRASREASSPSARTLSSSKLSESGSVFFGLIKIRSGFLSVERYQAFLVALIS
jgi:hypothetical protein